MSKQVGQQQKFYFECSNCKSRYFSEPMTLGVRNGRLTKIHPICTNCFEKCPQGHSFGYGGNCNVCGVPRRKFNLIRHALDPDDPTFGNTATGSTSYPTTNNGDTNIEATANDFTLNYIEAIAKFTITNPFTIKSVTIYQNTSGASHHVHIGLYVDSAGSPGGQSLVSGSDTGALTLIASTGWQTYAYTTPFYLAAGTYWITALGDTSLTSFWKRGGTASSFCYIAQTYGNLPSTFPNSPTVSTGPMSAYVTGVQIKNYAKATKAVLSENATSVTSISFYSHATGNVRLGIYNESGSAPNALQWESGSAACSAVDWATVNISAGTPSSLALNAGTYWLAWQWDSVNAGPSYTAGAAGDGYWIQQTYGAFPATWSGGTATVEKWSVYVTYATITLTQNRYRWYLNDSAEAPTAQAAEDTAIIEVASATVLRLRVTISVSGGTMTGWTLKLQYATSVGGSWTDVGAQAGAAIWRYYNGLGVDQAQVASALLTGTTVREHFVEAAPSATQIDVPTTGQGEWDFCIQHNGAADGTIYYFRIVKNDGTTVTYSVYPTLTTYPPFTDYGAILQYDPTKYSGTVTVYFEAQIKTSSGSIKAYARLWNITDDGSVSGSVVSTLSTSYSRQRSSLLSLPATAKEFKAQIGGIVGATASLKGSRLIIDVS